MTRGALLALPVALALWGGAASAAGAGERAAPAVSAPAPPRTLAAVAAAGEEPWMLHTEGGRARIWRGGAGAASFALPPGGVAAALAGGDQAWVAAVAVPRPDGTELALWRGDASDAVALPALPPRRAAFRHDPLPLLAAGGRLAGVAWLEGDALDRLAPWSARWDGRRWRDVGPVAPAGPGSQLALTGVVLADGSWLLAWSAFDGEADEVVWSRRAGAGTAWSPPRALPGGRGVPDVSPALRAAGKGALLAWSRYEGPEYRLLLSRFDGRGWSAPAWLAAAGSILPTWEGEHLLYRDARAAAWVAARVDGTRLAPLAALAGAPGERPLLLRREGDWRLLSPGEAAPPR